MSNINSFLWFYISWFSLFKDTPTIDKIKANRLTVRVNSDDIYFEKINDSKLQIWIRICALTEWKTALAGFGKPA